MSITVEEVVRHLAAITNTEKDTLLIGEWVNARWQEVAASHTLQVMEDEGELFIPAPYTTGTVTVTRGSTTVSGVGTGWTNSLTGRHIRAKVAWYEIATVVNPTTLELETPYGEDTTGGAGYNIVQRRHRLSPDARKLGVFTHMRLRTPLTVVHKQGLNLFIPSRHSVNSVPSWVAEVQPDLDGTKRVEIYPYSNRSEIIHYEYWAKPPKLGFKDYLPGFIDIEAFREGVMVDILRHKMFEAIDQGRMDAAAIYRNEFRAQETRWMRDHRVRLLGQDKGSDAQEFILSSQSAHPSRAEDRVINDAYSQVWWGD